MHATMGLEETEFVAVDLETTGLDPRDSSIVEIGAVRFRGDGRVLDQFEQLVDPQCRIPAKVVRIHGITNRMVKGAPTIAEALPALLQFIGNAPSILMAHNAQFDIGFLSAALDQLRRTAPPHPMIDTCGLARRRLRLPNYRLETIGRYLRLIQSEEHRALADALLLKDVFTHLVTKSPAIRSTGELLRVAPTVPFRVESESLRKAPRGYEGLWKAIQAGRPMTIVYHGGSCPGTRRTITPREIVRTRGRIYLMAYCHASRIEKSFRLDRIGEFDGE